MSVCVRMCVHENEAFALLLEKRTIRKVNATIETGQFWIDETQTKFFRFCFTSTFIFIFVSFISFYKSFVLKWSTTFIFILIPGCSNVK